MRQPCHEAATTGCFWLTSGCNAVQFPDHEIPCRGQSKKTNYWHGQLLVATSVVSDMHDELFRDPSKETRLRIQDDQETLGERSSTSRSLWKEGDYLDGFLLEKMLGSGSSGVVFRAVDVKTERRCALKLLKSGSPDDWLRNKLGFRRMMPIAHPNLLRVDRIYQLNSCIALSMEEVKGVTFGEVIKRYQKLDSVEAYRRLLSLLRDFAKGLNEMHSHELLHRDIKPDNLMVDESERGRIIDYGLVDSFGLNRPVGGTSDFLVGTPHYFPPEVICTQLYLPAGDIFSLGIVILDALYSLQSRADGEQAGLERSRKNQRADAEQIGVAIQKLPDSVPSTILDACREMLEQEPSDRPTAMGLSRLGLPRTQTIHWHKKETLIGRTRECREVFAWVENVFDGDVGRFHITGPSGIGKTRFLDEVVDYIDSKNWGQVFRAQCRLREDHPLQAFDQICDAVTSRYMRDDREVMTLDPVSVELLHGVFPVLVNVLQPNMQFQPTGLRSENLDKFEAAARLTEQLRLMGPLFLVIDDSQWADRETLNLLDRLQSAIGKDGLGIITASREERDPQRTFSTHSIGLPPLALDHSVTIVRRAADRWALDVSDEIIEELAVSTLGSPFRLQQLADEFRTGGAVADLADADVMKLSSLDRLWKKRADRLSEEARGILTYVMTSGGRVSTQQLGELTSLGETVDVAISELAQQGLVTDEATGGECITIFHDRVADELIKTLPEEDVRLAHHAWAVLLINQNDPERQSARVAGHLFAANEPILAVPYAIAAAKDSERRLAMTEAGRWYAQVIAHVEDSEKIAFLRKASSCYAAASLPVEASLYYQELSTLVDSEEAIECRLMAMKFLLLCGRLGTIRDQLHELAEMLGVPVPMSSPMSRWGSSMRVLYQKMMLGSQALSETVQAVLGQTDKQQTDDSRHGPGDVSKLDRQRLQMCMSLIRPMTFLDTRYAYQLCLANLRLVRRCGSRVDQVHALIVEAVFDCHEHGRRRAQAQTNLMRIQPEVERLNSDRASAVWWSGIAHSHALSCRWFHVANPAKTSICHYQNVVDASGFEIAHMLWIDIWSNWFVGNWSEMFEVADTIADDAMKRSDLFQLVLVTGGFGCGAWLGRDRTQEVSQLQERCADFTLDSREANLFKVFEYIAQIQKCIYEGKYLEGWGFYQRLAGGLRQFPRASVQLARVSALAVGTLLATHNYAIDLTDEWFAHVQSLTRQLRRERIGFACLLADLYDGLLQLHLGRRKGNEQALQDAKQFLDSARNQAKEQHLLPFRFAAEDALVELQHGFSEGLLRGQMMKNEIVCPERFIKLYTVPLE